MTTETLGADEQRLAELGYKQELQRGWSGFSNFAISFSIISRPRRLLHELRAGVEQRRPGRDLDRLAGDQLLILFVAFSMAELASAMPTAGGIYYWASKLGGAGWGWFTGWFNLIGLVAVSRRSTTPRRSFLMPCSGSTASTSSSISARPTCTTPRTSCSRCSS